MHLIISYQTSMQTPKHSQLSFIKQIHKLQRLARHTATINRNRKAMFNIYVDNQTTKKLPTFKHISRCTTNTYIQKHYKQIIKQPNYTKEVHK